MSVSHVDAVRSSFGRDNTTKENDPDKFHPLDTSESEADTSIALLENEGVTRDGLKNLNFGAYAVGHVFNDF
jgi:hypothetical protein